MLPIEQSLLYVQPMYLRAEGGRIPELKRVVLAAGNRVVMEESIDGAIDRLFGASGNSAPPVVGAPALAATGADAAIAGLIRSALDHYERARSAQRADDWEAYGREMRALGEILRQLDAAKRNP